MKKGKNLVSGKAITFDTVRADFSIPKKVPNDKFNNSLNDLLRNINNMVFQQNNVGIMYIVMYS